MGENPQEIVVDADALTLGDLEDGAKIAGGDLMAALEGKETPTPTALIALLYIVRRKTQPDITLDEVRAMPVKTILNLRVINGEATEEVDPT
jgi:hypothetical protein